MLNYVYNKGVRILRIFNFAWGCFCGYLYKFLVDLGLLRPHSLYQNRDDIIVSLTSYGRRVSDCVVYYTLISLLRQKIKPDKIILWLSKDEWNMENIPAKIRNLSSLGVEIYFCDDLKSYKKLVPSIIKYPNSTIITVDDDMIYDSQTISQLVDAHYKNPNDIICLYASLPIIKDGIPANYENWRIIKHNSSGYLIFPIGAAGILYPPNSLNEKVDKRLLFEELCPTADDIWFWFCGVTNRTNKLFIKKKGRNYSYDDFYQYFHKNSALTYTNKHCGKNDEQFVTLFKYFNFKIVQ